MENVATRNMNQIVSDLHATQENTVVQRRTIKKPYIDDFHGQPILHIPYGASGYDFAFGIDKAEALDKIISAGNWPATIKMMREEQARLQEKKVRDIIVV